MKSVNCFVLLISVLALLVGCSTAGKTPERRMGQVLVCHKQKETQSVSNPDYLRHIEHGDSAGPCPYGQ